MQDSAHQSLVHFLEQTGQPKQGRQHSHSHRADHGQTERQNKKPNKPRVDGRPQGRNSRPEPTNNKRRQAPNTPAGTRRTLGVVPQASPEPRSTLRGLRPQTRSPSGEAAPAAARLAWRAPGDTQGTVPDPPPPCRPCAGVTRGRSQTGTAPLHPQSTARRKRGVRVTAGDGSSDGGSAPSLRAHKTQHVLGP